jgi:hypothetical protein
MKTDEIPQDESALKDFTKEVCYAKNDKGAYETVLSQGWNVKKEALDAAWDDIENQKKEAFDLVTIGKKSPIYFFMVKNLMEISILSQYTGFWKLTIKRHFKPNVFKKLSDNKLANYAKVFNISVSELKNPKFG